MPGFDDRLTRELERAGRPAAPDVVRTFEDVTRRRARRAVVRKVQVVVVVVVILAVTAGSFVVLDGRLDESVPAAPVPANGLVAYVRDAEGSLRVFATDPSTGEELQLTTRGTDIQPRWSPDGTRIAFVRSDEEHPEGALAVLDVRTGAVRVLTDGRVTPAQPSWSPDGSRLAFAGSGEGASTGVYAIGADGGEPMLLVEGFLTVSDVAWSPDGSRIAFTVDASGRPVSWAYVALADGSDPRSLSPGADEASADRVVGWLPGGELVVQRYPGPELPGAVSRWFAIDPASGSERLLVAAPEGNVHPRATSVSPDGTAILVDYAGVGDTEVWSISIATGELRRITDGGGYMPDQQPISAGSQIIALDDLAPEVNPATGGVDIGLPVRLCDVNVLDGLDLVGEGGSGTAWTGYAAGEDGTCPRDPGRQRWELAIDVTGDATADVASGPLDGCRYTGCVPLGASDLDGDGDEELVVGRLFSIVDHLYFSLGKDDQGSYVVDPILVAEPGNPAASIEPGEPLVTSAGGDEGYSSWMRCEGYPEAPVLVWSWTNHPVDSDLPAEWHETKLRLEPDGEFHVIATDDLELPADEDPRLIRSDEPACGIRFDAWAMPSP